jgi:hypothetical protein
MLTLLVGFQKGWCSSVNTDKEPRVVSEMEQGIKRVGTDQEPPAQPVKKKARNTRASPLPSWGQIKRLAAEGKELLCGTSQSLTPEALLLARVAILCCQVRGTSGETYWAYVPYRSCILE